MRDLDLVAFLVGTLACVNIGLTLIVIKLFTEIVKIRELTGRK